MTEYSFLLYTTKMNHIKTICQLSMDSITRKKRWDETMKSPHKGSRYIISGLCIPGTQLEPRSQHRSTHGFGLEIES